MKTFNKKSNAKRAAEALAKRFPSYTVADPVAAAVDGEWYPALMAPKAVVDEGVPPEVAGSAYVNGKEVAEADATATYVQQDEPQQDEPQQEPTKPLRAQIEEAAAKRKSAGGKETKARAGSKREIVAELLLRKNGVTAKEILAATGWKALNIPGTARDLGIALRQVKEGRTTTYYGSR